jgi:hypothetical protein
MPQSQPAVVELEGVVEGLGVCQLVGQNRSIPMDKLQFYAGTGPRLDRHAGPTKQVDVRNRLFAKYGLPKGMEMFNTRQWSGISIEEMEKIRKAMKLDRSIPFGLLGENICVSGIPNFSQLPPGTQLFFSDGKKYRTTVLLIMEENNPCGIPANEIKKEFQSGELDAEEDKRNWARDFITAADGLRGVVGITLVTGPVKKGDIVTVVFPPVNRWSV